MPTPTVRQNEKEEILYKLGSLEATVLHLSETLTDSIKRVEEKIDSNAQYQNEKIEDIKMRTIKNEDRLEILETWRDGLMVKVGFLVSAVSLFWVVFNDPIQHILGNMF